jgi:hypothetical protein
MRSEWSESIDLARLERGVQLTCERVGDGRYLVTGGASRHWVDLFTPNHPRCDCGDHIWRDAHCKHILAAQLHEGKREVISAVGTLVAHLRAERGAPRTQDQATAA